MNIILTVKGHQLVVISTRFLKGQLFVLILFSEFRDLATIINSPLLHQLFFFDNLRKKAQNWPEML